MSPATPSKTSGPSHRPLAPVPRAMARKQLHAHSRRLVTLALLPLLIAPSLAVGPVPVPAPAAAAVGAGDIQPASQVVASAVDTLAELAAPAAAVAPVTVDADADAAPPTGAKKFEAPVVAAKDLPFDGNDGRPHEGPFVEVDNGHKDDDAEKTSVYIDGKKVPESNDGVMDDKNRAAPKHGTTGMTGGVSEKDKQRKAQEGQTGERVEKTPESPKEAPALPHHEESKITGSSGAPGEKPKDSDGSVLEKPADLPDKTHDKALPLPGSAQKDHLDITKSDKVNVPTTANGADATGIIQPFHSFVLSLTMILFSEIGDKTFLIAALMAMKHDRVVVFSAAFSALFAMTLLSAILGHAVPVLIPKRLTNFLACGLFLVFGAKLLREGMAMGPDEGVGAEMQEVELELAEKESQARSGRRSSRAAVSAEALEMGLGGAGSRLPRPASRFATPNRSASSSLSPPRGHTTWGGAGHGDVSSSLKGFGSGLSNLASLLLSPAWVQTFVMTFLGEWGDRSQIATVAMAAGQDYWWVTLGAITGHACCTGVAVIGGRALAGRVSMKAVTIGGAISFLVFGIIYLFEAVYGS